MRIVLISDTHGKHQEVTLPDGDLLIHAGDISGRGLAWEVEEFMWWFERRPHPHKVLIAGNHDFLAEREAERFESMVPANTIYLNDSGTEIGGLKIWGSPVQPWFHDWAFNRQRGEDIRKHWDLIPGDTDILVTHGPPHGILDRTASGDLVGCEELRKAVDRVRPRLHVFGHIHEAYGEAHEDGTHFVNASQLNLYYMRVFDPVVVDLD